MNFKIVNLLNPETVEKPLAEGVRCNSLGWNVERRYDSLQKEPRSLKLSWLVIGKIKEGVGKHPDQNQHISGTGVECLLNSRWEVAF